MNDDDERQRLHHQIEVLLERRRVAQARPLLSTALARFPDDTDFKLLAAWMEIHANQLDDAAQWCHSVLNDDPESVRARHLLAGIYQDQGELKDAESLYQSLLRDHPDNVDFLAALALLLFRTVHHERGHVLAEHAMAINPDHRQALQAAFFSALLRGDGSSVDTIVETVMADDPDSIQNMHTLLVLLEDRGQYSEARRLAQALLTVEPDNDEYLEWVIELNHKTHWSMLPVRWFDEPLSAASGIGLMGIGLLAWDDAGTPGRWLGGGLLAYALYCAAWPPILKKLMIR
ncbi:MAG: tetratricopeptide repeat protein [Pseudomonadota bacterium]